MTQTTQTATEAIPFQPKSNHIRTKRDILAKGLEAMYESQKQAQINGTSEMSLDEINEIIKECRQQNE